MDVLMNLIGGTQLPSHSMGKDCFFWLELRSLRIRRSGAQPFGCMASWNSFVFYVHLQHWFVLAPQVRREKGVISKIIELSVVLELFGG